MSKIKLPPLPEPPFKAWMTNADAKAYGEQCALAAIEADRELRGEPVTVRKVFICAACEGVYADQPVSQCDCMPEKDEFIEGTITYPSPAAPQPQQIPEDHSGPIKMFLDALTLARDDARGFMNKTGRDTDSLPEIDLAIDTARAMLEAAPKT